MGSALKVSDPFYGQRKVLWIRYARAGDGERKQKKIDVDSNGTLAGDLFTELDMNLDSQVGMAQMCISKEEFVSCVLNSTLLSETLRQLSTSDTRTAMVPPGRAIK